MSDIELLWLFNWPVINHNFDNIKYNQHAQFSVLSKCVNNLASKYLLSLDMFSRSVKSGLIHCAVLYTGLLTDELTKMWCTDSMPRYHCNAFIIYSHFHHVVTFADTVHDAQLLFN